MDPRDKWQVNEDALRERMRGSGGPRGVPQPDPEPGFGLPRWIKWTIGIIIAFPLLVMWLASGYSDEDHRRDHAAEQAELLCAKMMADAQLGGERRATRAMCDDLLRRHGKTLPP